MSRAAPATAAGRLAPLACWLLGVVAAFHPTFASGFAMVQGYPGTDPRLVNFILEHSWRWLTGDPAHAGFFSPPIFFPEPGVGAYTELLVGVAPPYWLARALGAAPTTAYQLWMITCWSLNYLAAYAMLRRTFAAGRAPAAAGSFLFAFGSARMAAMMHQQLVPYFLLVLAVIALGELFRQPDTPRGKTAAWLVVFALACVAQFATAFYPFYFFGLALLGALIWTLASRSLREPFLRTVRRNALALAGAGLLAAALLAPLAARYLAAAQDVGWRAYDPERLPRLASFFLMGPGNLLYGFVDHLPRFAPWSRSLHHNGLGLVTLLVAAVGLFRARRDPGVRLVVLGVLTAFALTLRLPGDVSLWGVTRVVVPGGGAIRAVARIGALLLFPGAIGLAAFFEQERARRPAWLLVTLALVCFVEQLNVSHGYDKRFVEWKVARVARKVDPRCRAFFLSSSGGTADHELHDDAMWVALATGVPTVNGRSGAFPPGWRLYDAHAADHAERARIAAELESWLERSGVPPGEVCTIEVDRGREAAEWASLERRDDEQR